MDRRGEQGRRYSYRRPSDPLLDRESARSRGRDPRQATARTPTSYLVRQRRGHLGLSANENGSSHAIENLALAGTLLASTAVFIRAYRKIAQWHAALSRPTTTAISRGRSNSLTAPSCGR